MNVLEGLDVVEGEHTEEALSCPHVLVPHGAVLLLTCSVQDVQQTSLSIDHHLLSVRVLKYNVDMIMQAARKRACQEIWQWIASWFIPMTVTAASCCNLLNGTFCKEVAKTCLTRDTMVPLYSHVILNSFFYIYCYCLLCTLIVLFLHKQMVKKTQETTQQYVKLLK